MPQNTTIGNTSMIIRNNLSGHITSLFTVVGAILSFLGIYPKQISKNQLLIFCSTNNVDSFINNCIKNPLIKKEIFGLKDVSYYIFNRK